MRQEPLAVFIHHASDAIPNCFCAIERFGTIWKAPSAALNTNADPTNGLTNSRGHTEFCY